jgi:hypothetical protein
MEAYLDEIYHDTSNPAAYGGINKLRDAARAAGYEASYGAVKKWAAKNEVYSMTKPLRRHFNRPHVPSPGLDYFWEADLIDFSTVSSDNDGYKFILVVVDTFGRYGFASPLKTKTPREVAAAFKSIVEEERRRPRYSLRTDAGSEFRGEFEKYLKTLSVHHYIARSDIHAAYAERFIKTIRTRMYRAFLNAQKHRWVDILSNIVTAYNATTHRMTGYAPQDVTAENEGLVAVNQEDIWRKLLKPSSHKSSRKPLYKPGDVVRVGALRRTFGRQYDQKFSGELFKVAKSYRRGGKSVYKLKDWDDDPIEGAFYGEELTAAAPPPDGRFKVDKVIKTRGRGRNKEAFVSWLHYPKKFNSWIPYDQIVDL